MFANRVQFAVVLALSAVLWPGLVQAAPRIVPCYNDRLVVVEERSEIAPAIVAPGLAPLGQQAEEPIVFGLAR